MATKDFKVRNGLIVGGTLTLGGNVVSKVLDSDAVTAIAGSGSNVVHSIGGDSDQAFSKLDTQLNAAGTPVSIGDIAYVEGASSVAYVATGTPSVYTGSHSLTIGSTAPSGDQRIIIDGLKISPLTAITASANNNTTSNIRLTGGVLTATNTAAAFPAGDSGAFCGWQPNLTLNIPGEGSARTGVHCLVVMKPNTVPTYDGAAYAFTATIAGIIPVSNTGSTTPTDIRGNFYSWTSGLTTTNISISQSGASYGLFPATLGSNIAAQWTKISNNFDSDQIVTIINENTTAGSIDSDVAAVAALRRDADSDSIRIQEIATSLEQINELVDSDLKAIGDLRNDVDSDSIRIQDLQTQISSIGGLTDSDLKAVADLRNDVDSDSVKLQALQLSVDGLSGTAAINTTVYTYTATQGQTTFTGADSNGLTLSYAPGKIYVFLNGVLILDTTDYTASNGSSVVLQEAADSDNTLQIIKHVGTVQTGFDSDQVVAIINENANEVEVFTVTLDSDVGSIGSPSMGDVAFVPYRNVSGRGIQDTSVTIAGGILYANGTYQFAGNAVNKGDLEVGDVMIAQTNTAAGDQAWVVTSLGNNADEIIVAALDSDQILEVWVNDLKTNHTTVPITPSVSGANDAMRSSPVPKFYSGWTSVSNVPGSNPAVTTGVTLSGSSGGITHFMPKAYIHDSDGFDIELIVEGTDAYPEHKVMRRQDVFDSDQIVAIINENTTAGSIDSDVTAVAALRRDADSDSIRIQEIATSLEQINELVDSDLKAIADLRNDVDSDSIKLQALEETVEGKDSDFVFSAVKIKASKNYYIQSSQPTITDTGQYWYDTDSDILYKSVPATALTTTIPAGSVNGSPYAGKLINWVSNNPSSVTRTDISGTDALGGTFTAGTNAAAWFFFTPNLSPPNLNGGMYFDFSSDVDIRGIVIEQSDPNAGRLAEIKYRNGDYADNNNGGTLTWYNSGGSALGKSVAPNGNTFRDISHPTGELAYRIGFEQIGDYYSGNDVFLFFAGSREWSPVKKGFDSDQVVAIINENTTAGSIDSDVAAVAQLRRDADSDSVRIQEIATSLEQINQLVDSDLKAIADLRNDVDSDSIAIAGLRSDVDSDSTKLQALQVSVDGLAGSAAINTTVYTYTATQGQTTFTGTDANGLTLAYAPGKIYVFLNGVLILDTTDYTATNGTSIVLQEAADSDNTVQIIKHVGTVQIGFDSDQVVSIINEGNSVTSTQIDSDRNAGHSARVYRITSTSELDTLNTNNGLGTRTGVARVGDIAYIANPFKAYVLTNIYSAASYQNTGFHVQTNNGTVTRMFFDVVPAGQLPSENFAVGTLIGQNSGGGDQRTVTAVSDTGGMFSKGYLDFTPSDSGYAPGWDNKTVYASSADQTTWQKFSFDSDHVAQIISEAGVGGFDSDQVVSIVNENSGVNFIVANNGSSAYTFTGDGFPSGVDNPTLYLKRGHTYRFKLAVTGHPFEIRSSSGGLTYSTGVTNNTAQTGVTTFTVPMDAPDTLVYQCTAHSSMVGTIKIGRQGFDSDQIVAIINENTTAGSIDSDVAAVAALRRDADSDNIRIQEIATSLEQINELVDSDLKAIADLRNDVDSDSIKLQALQETVAGLGSGGSSSGMTDSDLKVVADLRNEVDALNLTSGPIDQNATFTTFKYKTTNGQTTISGVDRDNQTLSYVAGSINVFLNGVLLNDSDDYTASNGSSVVLQLAADSDDVVVVQKVASSFDSETVQSIWNDNYQALDISRFDFTAIQNQTTFTGADDNGATLSYFTNKVQVYLNGILLLRTTDYVDTSGTQIVLTQAADSDDKLTIIKYIGQTATENLTITRFTYGFGDAGNGTVGATNISGNDDNGNSLLYEVGKIQVFSNGVLLEDSDDYIANDGSSIILQQGADSDDKISIIKYNGAIQRVDGVGFDSDQIVAIINESNADDILTTRYVYKVTSGGHSVGDSEFTGADDNGVTLSYTVGKVQVFLNGILLNDSDDYTATNGSSVILTTAPDSDDVLSIFKFLGTQVAGFDSDQVVAIINENTGSAGFDSDQVVGIVYENVAEALTTTNPHTVKGARFGRTRNGLDSDGTPEYHLKLIGAASIATDSENDVNDSRYFSEKKVCRIDYSLGQSDICIISYGEPHNQEGSGYYDSHIIKYDFAGHNGGSGSGARSDASWGLRTVNGTWTSTQMSAGSTIGSPPAITVTHDSSNKRFIVQSNGQPYGTYNIEIVSGRYAIDVEWLV